MTFSIGRQIGAGFALVLLLFAVVAGVAILQMNAMQRETSQRDRADGASRARASTGARSARVAVYAR